MAGKRERGGGRAGTAGQSRLEATTWRLAEGKTLPAANRLSKLLADSLERLVCRLLVLMHLIQCSLPVGNEQESHEKRNRPDEAAPRPCSQRLRLVVGADDVNTRLFSRVSQLGIFALQLAALLCPGGGGGEDVEQNISPRVLSLLLPPLTSSSQSSSWDLRASVRRRTLWSSSCSASCARGRGGVRKARDKKSE